ncbi:NAD(P)H-dependent oxidoreductase [soil metagenome]
MDKVKRTPFIVGIGGTMRPDSGSEWALKAALSAAEAAGARTQLFGGADLAKLPIYDPACIDTAPRAALTEAVRAADGLLICSPGYHGSISGLIKNALDGLEDLRADTPAYLDGRAAGLIVMADGWQAGGTTLTAMRSIIHALRGWPTPLGVVINATARDPQDDVRLVMVAEQVVDFARMRIAAAD